MDDATLQQLWDIHDRRKAASDAKAAEWAVNPPLDAEGNPARIGAPLVEVPITLQRQLTQAARPAADDGPDEKRKLADLLRGARLADIAAGVCFIQLQDLYFLLERVPESK